MFVRECIYACLAAACSARVVEHVVCASQFNLSNLSILVIPMHDQPERHGSSRPRWRCVVRLWSGLRSRVFRTWTACVAFAAVFFLKKNKKKSISVFSVSHAALARDWFKKSSAVRRTQWMDVRPTRRRPTELQFVPVCARARVVARARLCVVRVCVCVCVCARFCMSECDCAHLRGCATPLKHYNEQGLGEDY
jgi:hypothetical protein